MANDNDYTGLGVNSQGVFLIGAEGGNPPHLAILHRRNLTTGAIEWTAYDDEIEFSNNSSSGEDAMRCAVDDDYLYVSGFSDLGDFDGWRMQRRSLSDGSILRNVTSQPGDNNCYPSNLTLNDSNVFFTGSVERSAPAEKGWRIECRDKTLLGLVWFKEYVFATTKDGIPFDACANSTHVFIAGYEEDDINGFIWRVECRLASDGSLVWTRNVTTTNSQSTARAITIYGDALFVMGEGDVSGSFKLFVKKLKVSDGTDYGGGWSDNVFTQQLLVFCSYPCSLSANEYGLFALGTEYKTGAPASRIFQRKKINMTTGADMWVANSANYGGTIYSYAMKIAAHLQGVYLCGIVLYNTSPFGSNAYVQKVRA